MTGDTISLGRITKQPFYNCLHSTQQAAINNLTAMLLLGIDVGAASVKVSVMDADTRQCLASVSYPEEERELLARQPGWVEQPPLQWWQDVRQAILRAHATQRYNPENIGAIGIACQMHGLVLMDAAQHVLRDAIIWCDSRAVPSGKQAFQVIGPEQCLTHLLSSPGNFTAARLAWVKEHEPEVYARIQHVLLPGDFIALQLTGAATPSISALSAGISWDFAEQQLSEDAHRFFGFDKKLVSPAHEVFTAHGQLRELVAEELGLQAGTPVTYKAGNQPNSALSLGVLEPGDVAATAGTSGVIYTVTDQPFVDPQSQVNFFGHLNHSPELPRLGILLCINGAGSINRWVKQAIGRAISYPDVNWRISHVPAGSEGLLCLPFGNGVERVLAHESLGASFLNLDLNVHGGNHMLRAAQEGVAFAFRYGLDLMRENGLHPTVIKASKADMFLSEIFAQVFANATGLTVELYRTSGSVGAALGAGIGVGIYATPSEAFKGIECLQTIRPDAEAAVYEDTYQEWKRMLELLLATSKPHHQTQRQTERAVAAR
jgi:xylulokinase